MRANNFIKGASKHVEKNTPSQESKSMPKKEQFLRKNVITGRQQDGENNFDQLYANNLNRAYNYQIEEDVRLIVYLTKQNGGGKDLNNSFEDKQRSNQNLNVVNSQIIKYLKLKMIAKNKKKSIINEPLHAFMEENDDDLRKSPISQNKLYNNMNIAKKKKNPYENPAP